MIVYDCFKKDFCRELASFSRNLRMPIIRFKRGDFYKKKDELRQEGKAPCWLISIS